MNGYKMRFLLLFVGLAIASSKMTAQYDVGAMNYGLAIAKNYGEEKEWAVGARVEYAFNCFTTFMGEYNHTFSFHEEHDFERYSEFAAGVNLILFNWYPTTITAGMGYIGNNSKAFENIEDKAYLSFKTGNFNHGVQIKIRALHQVSTPIHIFAEVNAKSLGKLYHTFLIGFNYDFNAR